MKNTIIDVMNTGMDEIIRVRQEAQMEILFKITDVIIREVKETVIASPFDNKPTAMIGIEDFNNNVDLYETALELFTEKQTIKLQKGEVELSQDGENIVNS